MTTNRGGKPKKPASLQTGNNLSRAMKAKLMEKEQLLVGSKDLIDQPPAYLGELAVEYYNHLIDQLSHVDYLSNLDIPLIASAAIALAEAEKAYRDLQQYGQLMYDEMGNAKPHPANKLYREYSSDYARIVPALGLSPASRSSLAAMFMSKEQEKEDETNPLLGLGKK